MQQTLPWVLTSIAVALLAGAALLSLLVRRKPRTMPLPTEWTLTARPVFSTDERRVYRQLREALPHHALLSKLPLVRFCQPADPAEVRFWYELLGTIHVTFAICSANGRVLAAIDLDTDRSPSRRVQQIKQSVLGACRVRYLRCPADHLPSVPELQLLVPQSVPPTSGAQPAPTMSQARDQLASTVASRRRERNLLWQEPGCENDSYFGAQSRRASNLSDFGGLPPDDLGGIVVDGPMPLRH